MADPTIVTSSKSQKVEKNGHIIRIEIYTLEGEDGWALELIDEDGTSLVWEEQFNDDQVALDLGLEVIEKEGIGAFRKSANVIPLN